MPDHEAVIVPHSDDPAILDDFMLLWEALNIRSCEKNADRQWRERSIKEIGYWNFMIHGSGDAFHKVSDFFAGWGDHITDGGTEQFRKWFGYDDAVNKNSGAYKASTVVGDIHDTLLKGVGVHTLSSAGHAMAMAEGIANGDLDAIMAAAEAIAMGKLQRMGGCGDLIAKGMQGLAAAQMIADAKAAFDAGDMQKALKLLADASLIVKQMKSCFAAGTKLWTRQGYKKIEEFRKGDRLFSRSEHDPCGLIEEKVVEDTIQCQALCSICTFRVR